MVEFDKIGEGYVAVCPHDIVTISKQHKLWVLSSANLGKIMCFMRLSSAMDFAEGEFGN